MHRPWTRREIALVAAAQVVGVLLALPLGFVALLLLPEHGLFATPNDAGDRLEGVAFAVGAAVLLPAGLWVAAALRRSRATAFVAGAATASVLVVAALAAADGHGGWA